MFDSDIFKSPIFDFYPAMGTPIGFISVPHSGMHIPVSFKKFLLDDRKHLDCDVDYKVDDLLNFVELNKTGIAVIVAKTHRTCVDLNRSRELACLNWKHNTQGAQIVIAEPSEAEVEEILKNYYDPYYQALTVMGEKLKCIVDFHSMPSRPTEHHLKQNPHQKTERADTCISDLKGKSCDPAYIDHVIAFLERRGVGAAKNDPYFGGHVTVFLSEFEGNNIQIEVNRRIYMDETKKETFTDKVSSLRPIFTELMIDTFKKFA